MMRSFIVHNVANAILDTRMAAWCCRRRRRRHLAEEGAQNNGTDKERTAVNRFCREEDEAPNVFGQSPSQHIVAIFTRMLP